MSSATAIPAEVEKKATESRQIQKDLIGGKLTFSEDGKAIIPDGTTDAPDTTQAGKDKGKIKPKKQGKKQGKTVDDKGGAPDTKDGDKKDTAEYWQNRLTTLENMNKATITDLQAQVAKLEDERTVTNNILANLTSPKASATEDSDTSVVKPEAPIAEEIEVPKEDIEVWGDDQYQFTRKVVKAELAPIAKKVNDIEVALQSIDTLSSQINKVVESQQTQAAQSFNGQMASLCPDWETFSFKGGTYTPQFFTWAGKTLIPMTDTTYQQQFENAYKKQNAPLMADIINNFKELAGLGAEVKQPKAGSEAVQADAVNAGTSDVPTLQEQVVPDNAAGDESFVTQDKTPPIRESEIQQIFTDIAKGKYTEDEAIALKRRIATAIRDNTLIRDV